MSIYTVHEPPLKAGESAPDPDRFVFVRDGFSFCAFLLAPLWMLRHRLWLVFVGYVIVAVALQVGLRLIGASPGVIIIVSFLLALLVGFEAATLRRFTLSRRRWNNVGVVLHCQDADYLDAAGVTGLHGLDTRSLVRRIRSEGAMRAVVSTELDEVLGLADRIAVMYRGRIIGEVPGGSSAEEVGLLMAGSVAPHAPAEADS